MAEDASSYQQSPLPITNQPWWKTKAVGFLALVVFLLVVALVLIGLLGNTASVNKPANTSPTPTPTPQVTIIPSTTPTVLATPTPTAVSIDVYFSKHPDSDNNFSAVFAVKRNSTSLGVAHEAFASLLQGPTSSELSANFFSSWTLSGTSNCGSDGFTIVINSGKATVKLCQDYNSAGIGQDARAQAEADATLKQFATITKTVYLNKNGDCLFDQSGQNACLKS